MALTKFVTPSTRKGPNGGLGGAVHTHAWKTLGCGNRCIQDDRSSIVHEWKSFLHREEQSLHVGVKVKIEEFLVHASEWRQAGHAGVRENHVNLLTVSLSTVCLDCLI